MTDHPTCEKTVFRSDGGFFGGSDPCTRNGKVLRDGHWYCKQHDPEAVRLRKAESDRKYTLDCATRKRDRLCKALGKAYADRVSSVFAMESLKTLVKDVEAAEAEIKALEAKP